MVTVVGYPESAGQPLIHMMHLKFFGAPERRKTGLDVQVPSTEGGSYKITIHTTTGPIEMVAGSNRRGDWKIGEVWFELANGNLFVMNGVEVRQLPVTRRGPAMIVEEKEIVRVFNELGY